MAKYFTAKICCAVGASDTVLDLGCGPGAFLPIVSRLSGQVVGVDISDGCVKESNKVIRKFGLKNTHVVEGQSEELCFPDNTFNVILMVDVIHHLARVSETLHEVARVLKPHGRVIVYEPNILNPALFLMCLLDRNEWGTLGLGRKKVYRRLFEGLFEIESMEYNGILIGAYSALLLKLVDLLDRFAAWMNPKILMMLKPFHYLPLPSAHERISIV